MKKTRVILVIVIFLVVGLIIIGLLYRKKAPAKQQDLQTATQPIQEITPEVAKAIKTDIEKLTQNPITTNDLYIGYDRYLNSVQVRYFSQKPLTEIRQEALNTLKQNGYQNPDLLPLVFIGEKDYQEYTPPTDDEINAVLEDTVSRLKQKEASGSR